MKKKSALRKNIPLFTIICLIFIGNMIVFSQIPKSKKLVKCFQHREIVYRKKCRIVSKNKTNQNNKTTIIKKTSEAKSKPKTQKIETEIRSGIGMATGPPIYVKLIEDSPLEIISKPRPGYTETARQKQFQGFIRLSITFLATGKIGKIIPLNNMPYGLTEKAVEAAKNIRFNPAVKNGEKITIIKNLDFYFTIY